MQDLRARFKKHTLNFIRPSGTSRGILHTKDSWIIEVSDSHSGNKYYGECSIIEGLSLDDKEKMVPIIHHVCENISIITPDDPILKKFPSVKFGLEMLLLSMRNKSPFCVFDNAFMSGKNKIPINGLVWMGDTEFMKSQIVNKIGSGFDCIKIKVGAIKFEEEVSMLRWIRNEFSERDLILRLDANGAFHPDQALEKLKILSDFHIHSIEQPIKPGQYEAMANLCQQSPIAIALDEELIPTRNEIQKAKLIEQINPQYIILKPSLLGGFESSIQWITLANKYGINFWLTSALESNIGLNAIAQFTTELQLKSYQGLGTGSLYTNNFRSPLLIHNGYLMYDENIKWQVTLI